MQIKLNDNVKIITGNDSGVTGKVLAVYHETGRVLVEGVNRVYKHVKRSQRNPQGGRLSKEMPVDVSNVMIVCVKCNKPSRMGMRYTADGSKERFCKKCGGNTADIAPAKAAYAAKKA